MDTLPQRENFNEDILRSLRRIIRAVDLYSRQLASRHSLTGPQLVCLRQLVQNGGMTPGHLAHQVALSPATVTGILDRLEARGLLTRERRPEDKRQVLINLTGQGRKLVQTAPLPLQECLSKRLAELPHQQQQEIQKVLNRLVEMMEAEHLDAAPVLSTGPTTAEPDSVVAFLGANGHPTTTRRPDDDSDEDTDRHRPGEL